jgi:enoyl-CoA hydratase/carnithine racemase
MSNFESYASRYRHAAFQRRDGILQTTLHSGDGELLWSAEVHEELSYAFYDIARDHENRCVILTGQRRH